MPEMLPFPPRDSLFAAILDRWLSVLDHYELRCLLYILRRTVGYGKTQDAIALSQFVHGIARADGAALDGGTGLSPRGVRRGIAGLERRGIIRVLRSKRPGTCANETNVYGVIVGDPDAALLHAIDAALDTGDPWCETDPSPHADSAGAPVPELGAAKHQTQEEEKKERKNAGVPGFDIPDRIQNPSSLSPALPDPTEKTDAFAAWWLKAVAAHNGQRPRMSLTDTDRATIARWRALGASDAFICETLDILLAADTHRRIYALAYCDHALKGALARVGALSLPSRVSTSRPTRRDIARLADASRSPHATSPQWWQDYSQRYPTAP